MARNKSSLFKIHLGSLQRSNRMAPVWVRLKTNNNVDMRPRRNWRRTKLTRKIRIKLKKMGGVFRCLGKRRELNRWLRSRAR